jgi:RNA polymerase sigma-70 factor, ECF subfamily
MTLTPTRPEAGTDFALRVLYRDHAAALLAYAAWFTDDRSAAEDAVQETFLRAWRHLPRLLSDDRPLRPWLRQVLRHLMTDAARVARSRRLRPLDEVADPEVDGGYDSVLDRGQIAAAVRRLSPVHRRVLIELYYRDVSAERAAATLGIPAGTIRSRHHYALRALRQELSGGAADAPRRAPGRG